MRIRKNSKIAQPVSTPLQAHVCQLNQSPWDIPTTDFSPSTASSPLFQLQEDDSFTENGLFKNMNGALESVAKISLENGSVDEEEEKEKLVDIVNYCSKTDENGNWICGLEAEEGETFCEFHLRSYIDPAVVLSKKSTTKLGKISGAKKSKSEVNPYQGFRPDWEKRRAARELSETNEVVRTPSLLNGTEDSNDYEKEEYEKYEVKNVNENGKKRGRKRIKERSLKSLM